MPKVVLTCAECGAEFERFPSQAGRFCSWACMCVNAKVHGWRRKAKTGEYFSCVWCGEQFWVIPSRFAKAVYCSLACQHAHDGRTTATCQVCAKEFKYYPSNRRGDYCTKACEGVSKYKRLTGRTYNGKPVLRAKSGYARCYEPSHPRSLRNGWISEHTLVMESVVGRYLMDGENVHHKNGVRDDNHPENLELWARPQPTGCRAIDLLAWARQIVEIYEPLEDVMAWHYVEDYEELTGKQRELADDPDAPPAKPGVKAKVVTPPTKAKVGKADVQVETA